MRCLQEKDLSQTHSFFREYVACLKKSNSNAEKSYLILFRFLE